MDHTTLLAVGDWVRYPEGHLPNPPMCYDEIAELEPVPHIVKLVSGIYIRIEDIIEVRKPGATQ